MGVEAATVFVIDDEAEVREAVSRLLRSAGLEVVAHDSAQEFLANAPYRDTGCILLDVNMPGMTGPELHDRLRDSGISLPVIYLTGQCSVSVGVRAMKKGACDFLEKPVDAETLLPAIEQALSDYRRFQLGQQKLGDIERRLATLSRREREVLGYVIAGRLNKQIAGEMEIAEKTVKVHRGRVMAKMRCRSVAELVHLCDELGHARQPGRSGA
ncbi:MAG: response regulator [Pseudoxanthomonas sp.]